MESTTNPLAPLAAIAEAENGVHEQGGENTGPRVREYQAATSLGGTGWPWCAAFVCWCVLQLVQRAKGLLSCEGARPTQASVEEFIEWAKKSNQLVFTLGSTEYQPQRGDIVCFHWPTGYHIGICKGPKYRPNPNSEELLPTIEGNTTGPYHQKQDPRNGGEVANKLRTLGEVVCFIRLTVKGKRA